MLRVTSGSEVVVEKALRPATALHIGKHNLRIVCDYSLHLQEAFIALGLRRIVIGDISPVTLASVMDSIRDCYRAEYAGADDFICPQARAEALAILAHVRERSDVNHRVEVYNENNTLVIAMHFTDGGRLCSPARGVPALRTSRDICVITDETKGDVIRFSTPHLILTRTNDGDVQLRSRDGSITSMGQITLQGTPLQYKQQKHQTRIDVPRLAINKDMLAAVINAEQETFYLPFKSRFLRLDAQTENIAHEILRTHVPPCLKPYAVVRVTAKRRSIVEEYYKNVSSVDIVIMFSNSNDDDVCLISRSGSQVAQTRICPPL